MNCIITKFMQFLMYREDRYKPRHTVCAIFGFWIQTPTKQEGNYVVRYMEIYWGLFPYLAPLSVYLFGTEKPVMEIRAKLSVPVQKRCISKEVESLQRLFDNNEVKVVF